MSIHLSQSYSTSSKRCPKTLLQHLDLDITFTVRTTYLHKSLHP
jgi:hypothetical protein